jgi:RHS repeat-associated protein
LTNSSGAAAETYTYDSFGKQIASAGSLTNSFRYTGREFDSETGLYYYRSRYYDPNVGRFMTEDSFKEVLRGLNFYAYVRNNPVAYTDPTGMTPWDWWDKLWDRLGFARKTWNSAKKATDWSLCGVYYTECLETGMDIKREIAQALNSPDPVVYATALATLAQQTGSNSISQLNINVCMNNENCQKALECAKKGLTNPLPFPIK